MPHSSPQKCVHNACMHVAHASVGSAIQFVCPAGGVPCVSAGRCNIANSQRRCVPAAGVLAGSCWGGQRPGPARVRQDSEDHRAPRPPGGPRNRVAAHNTGRPSCAPAAGHNFSGGRRAAPPVTPPTDSALTSRVADVTRRQRWKN